MPEPRDPDDDRETLASGPGGTPPRGADDSETLASAPGAGADEPPTGDADPAAAPSDDDFLGMESLPPRPRTGGTGSPPRGPGSAPPSVRPMSRAPEVDDDERATLASAAPGSTETPTGDVSDPRDLETNAGGFAPDGTSPGGTVADVRPGQTVADDDKATMADASLEGRQREILDRSRAASSRPGSPAPTVGDVGAGSATARSQGPVPASKWSRGTARDPVAGTAAGRGTGPGARASGPTPLAEGQLLADRYELVRRLGKGGMGEVWQARHTLLQGMRAIKVIKASISRDPSFRARFLSEGQTMMRVKHAGVVEVTDLDETRSNRELFMVMEHLQGRTMHDAVRDEKAPLCADVRNAVRIFRELALGMQRIHDERIVHKDLKTDNVILVKGEDGLEHPKVIDFGLAKRMGETGDVPADQGASDAGSGPDHDLRTTLSGTLAYMAPEQFLGEPSSFQSDIYALGVMVYECFMKGDYPMPRGSLVEYMQRHREGSVPRRLRQAAPTLDAEVAELADRCMAPQRSMRPASMQAVADEMQRWLEAPERARRRRKLILTTSAAAALVAVAVYGFFFRKQAGGVSNVALRRADGAAIEFARERFHLPAGALTGLAFEGSVTGEPGRPSVLVDGAEHAADVRIDGTKLTGTVSLDDLADGEHAIGFRASAGADPQVVRVVVDRRPPVVTSVELSTGPGRFTKSANPEIRIRLDTPAADMRSVKVRVGGTEKSADRDAGDPHVWTASGLTTGDGDFSLRILATDLAGNPSPSETPFELTQDTVPPSFDVAGLVDGRLQVREAQGNRIVVSAGEASKVTASFARPGESVPQSRDADAAAGAEVEIAVPDVPGGGLTARIVRTDRAGNAFERTFAIVVVADEVSLTTPDGRARTAVARADGVQLHVRRSYPLGGTPVLTRTQVGGDAASARAIPVDAVFVQDPKKDTDGTLRIREEVPAGVWALSLTGLGGVRPSSFTLVVDAERPRVEGWTVADANGESVARDAWCLTQDAVIVVDVSDLALASATLGGRAPDEPMRAGRGSYTFRAKLAEGANSLPLVVRDEAGNEETRAVDVRADWTDPVLRLDSPKPGDALDNTTATRFEGSCSEPEYALVVTGLERELRSEHTDRAFADQWILPPGDHDLTVVAVDRTRRRRSAPVAIRLHVERRMTELPAEVTWSAPPSSRMRKVAAGDVVIDGRTQPVPLVFLDLTEVTNRQYRQFLDACSKHAGKSPWDHAEQPAGWSHVPTAETWNDPRWNADDLPVVGVAWWDAYAFAKWSGRRLPTEAEWVKAAAKADGELELRQWPPAAAGTKLADGVLATAESTSQKGPVDATRTGDVSPSGCLHMGGNVSEWVDVPFAREGELRTGVRGGSFWTTLAGADVRRVPTKPYDRSFRARTIGFRCAVDASEVRP